MTLGNALKHFDPAPNEPSAGYITPDDVKAAFTEAYADLGLPSYATIADLPVTNLKIGQTATVRQPPAMMLWNGTAWQNVSPDPHSQVTYSASSQNIADPAGAKDGDLIIILPGDPGGKTGAVFRRNGPTNWGQIGTIDDTPQTRVTHPNGTDVLVEVWDASHSRWQRTHYDSGPRAVLCADPAQFGVWRASLRRVDAHVTLQFDAHVDAGTLNGAAARKWVSLIDVPLGFQSDWHVFAGAVARYNVDFLDANYYPGRERLSAYSPDPDARSWVAEDKVSGTLTWPTRDPIPTSLPGTPNGAAPNQMLHEEHATQND